MNQRDAVRAAVKSVVGEIHQGKAVELNKEQKRQVHQILIAQFISGEVEFKGSRDQKTVKDYVPGLVNNWLRKDPQLNGGGKYTPKNPGIRAGSGDEQIKALNGLLRTVTDQTARSEVEAAIQARKDEIARQKAKPINVEALPEHLRKFVPVASAQ